MVGKFYFRELDELDSLVLAGGVGLPYKYGSMNKKSDYYTSSLEHYYKFLSNFVNLGTNAFMWDVFPKIEILNKEKSNSKVRVISGQCVEMYLLGAQLYESFNTSFLNCSYFMKSAVGRSLTKGGSSEIVSFLGQNNIQNADCTGFDHSLSSALLWYVYKIREDMSSFNDAQREYHWAYYRQIVSRTCFTSNGDVYNVVGGNPSGQYNTTIDNTIAHIFIIAYSMIRSGYSFKDFVKFRALVYGDDYIGQYMPPSFWQGYRELGIQVRLKTWDTIWQADFLSHNFVNTPYGVVSKLNHNKSLYSSWTSDTHKWRDYRPEKLYSIWLENYFGVDGPVYEALMDKLCIPYNPRDAVEHWTYRL